MSQGCECELFRSLWKTLFNKLGMLLFNIFDG